MGTHVLEGTVREVTEQLQEIPLPSEARVRLVLEELEQKSEAARFRNGIMLVLRSDRSRLVTTEFVMDLLHVEKEGL